MMRTRSLGRAGRPTAAISSWRCRTWSNLTHEADLTRTAIGVVDLDAKTPSWKRLTDWTLWATYPDWHPSKGLIVFSTRPWGDLPDGPSNLYTIAPDGSALTRITTYGDFGHADPPAVTALDARWDPDHLHQGHRHRVRQSHDDDDPPRRHRHVVRDGLEVGTHPRLRPLP